MSSMNFPTMPQVSAAILKNDTKMVWRARASAPTKANTRRKPISAAAANTNIDPSFHDRSAFRKLQSHRAIKMFSAVVLAVLDDAIADQNKNGSGEENIKRWARSRDGREVMTCAGIDPNERVVENLAAFVSRGTRTSKSLNREECRRRAEN